MLIAVEGMDGVGKTAIAKYISLKYEFKFIEKPLHYFYNDGPENKYEDLMKVANRMYDVNDDVVKSWYFSLGNIFVSRMFKNEDVVIDRHLVSNYYWNASEESEVIFNALIEVSGVPDLTILLYATPETRMERLRKRDKNDPDLNDPDKKDDGYDKMMYFIQKYNLPYVLINTEGKDLDTVKKIVDDEIAKIEMKRKKLVRKNGN